MATGLLAVIAFLAGSLPMGVFVTRAVTGKDIRSQGSGNIGAANVARSAGLKVGLIVLALDMLKGVFPVLAGVVIGVDTNSLALIALAAVLGHDFSIFLRFHGGKGVATTLGVMVVLAPLATILSLLTYVVVMLPWRYASLSSLAALATLPVYCLLTHRPGVYVILASVLFLLSVAKHWENIQRLVSGNERKFGSHAG